MDQDTFALKVYQTALLAEAASFAANGEEYFPYTMNHNRIQVVRHLDGFTVAVMADDNLGGLVAWVSASGKTETEAFVKVHAELRREADRWERLPTLAVG